MLVELYSIKENDFSEIKLEETRYRYLEDPSEALVKEEDIFPETVAWAADTCLGSGIAEEDTEFVLSVKDETKYDVGKKKSMPDISNYLPFFY